MTTTHPICPVCRYPRRAAADLAQSIRAAVIPVRDAHTKLDQPQARRDAAWALGRLDEARAALEAVEDSCACPSTEPPLDDTRRCVCCGGGPVAIHENYCEPCRNGSHPACAPVGHGAG